MPSLAVVGAGVAGLGAAHALTGTDVEVAVFEARDRVGGRVATRRRDGCVYDTGANYVKGDDERVNALLRDLGADGLVDVESPVWTFTGDGDVAPGDDRDDHKWTHESGIAEFAYRLGERVDATVHAGTRIEGLTREAGWALDAADGTRHRGFDAVLLTPPAPTTADLLAATAWDDPRREALRAAAADVPYRTIRSLALHYPFAIDRPYYALVNTDRAHDVGWLAREGEKRGHVPAGETLLIAQMAPDWSAARYDEPVEAAAEVAAGHAAALLDDGRLREPDWVDCHDWRHALPDVAADRDTIRAAEDAGLFAAGDWLVGEGRVARAFRTGADAGGRIAERLAR